MKSLYLFSFCLYLITCLPLGFGQSIPKHQDTEFLTFEELVTLSQNPVAQGPLRKKLDRFWVTPIIDNEPYFRGVPPHYPINGKIGKSLIAVTWNIEKSIHADRVINLLISDKSFELMIDPKKASTGSKQLDLIQRQRKKLLMADIIILQEIEIGIKRSDYMDTPRELASALDMNYAYAPQYLEVDPVILGKEKVAFEDGRTDQEATDYFAVDQTKYKGAFGSAVLSRFPIKKVEIIPLKFQPYDWYWGEKSKPSYLEKMRRFGSFSVFKNEIHREMKVGGRHFFRVDLEVPDLPGKTLTVLNIHLEIKCLPKDRARQIAEVLSYARNIKNPVIMAGDFNAAPHDLSNTSVSKVAVRSLKNPTNWFSLALNTLTPHAMAINVSRGVSNVTKNFQDPTVKHIPVIAPNPSKSMFDQIEDFRFFDGGVFDFRGDQARSVRGNRGTLSNSNQRDTKGFKTTFKVIRPIGPWLGKYRLDWFFVKSYVQTHPRDKEAPYRFAPHFGETLEELNTSLKEQLSDHHPSVIYLPYDEPKLPTTSKN